MFLSTETEVKVAIKDPEEFCGRLQALQPRTVTARHFEDNHLFDFRDNALTSAGRLVRIRRTEERTTLTYKGPLRKGGLFASREELETGLENGAGTMQILERLGMRVWFRYEKYRREFEVDGVIVAVDETPIGNYAELEGTEQSIGSLARRLGLTESSFLRQSYHSLYLGYCRLKGLAPENMVFDSVPNPLHT
jgi:adenylate cyclase class 2